MLHVKRLFKRLVQDVKAGENIDVYIIFLLSLVLAVLGVVGVIQATILSAGILATLSILAYSTLAIRHTLIDFKENLNTFYSGETVPFKSRRGNKPFRELIESTHTLWLYGQSLLSLWPPHADLLLEKVNKGGELRILVFNPESARLPIVAEQVRRSPESLKSDILKTLMECKDFSHEWTGIGRFEVRLTEGIPGYNMIICDPNQSNGELRVEFYGYHSNLNDRPHIELYASRNRYWFDYYLGQYNELWESATPFPTK